MEYFKEVSIMVAETFDDYDDQRHKLINERDMLWVNKFSIDGDVQSRQQKTNIVHGDALVTRAKHSRAQPTKNFGVAESKAKVMKKCMMCRQTSHNKRMCPTVVNQNSSYKEQTYKAQHQFCPQPNFSQNIFTF